MQSAQWTKPQTFTPYRPSATKKHGDLVAVDHLALQTKKGEISGLRTEWRLQDNVDQLDRKTAHSNERHDTHQRARTGAFFPLPVETLGSAFGTTFQIYDLLSWTQVADALRQILFFASDFSAVAVYVGFATVLTAIVFILGVVCYARAVAIRMKKRRERSIGAVSWTTRLHKPCLLIKLSCVGCRSEKHLGEWNDIAGHNARKI